MSKFKEQTPGPNSNSSMKSSRFRRPGKRTVAIISVLLVAAGAGGFAAYKAYDENKKTGSLPNFSYDTENKSEILKANHLISGNGQRTGMAFQLPLNGIVYPDSPYSKSDERLIPKNRDDVLEVNGLHAEYGLRHVAADGSVVFQSLIAGLILLPGQQSGFSKEDYFKAALNNLSFRLDSKDSSKISFTLSGEKSFTNDNISINAKIYQLTAETSTESKVAVPIKRMQGELIEIKGKNADYYMLISGTDSIWASGSSTWQDIKGSLKVDQ